MISIIDISLYCHCRVFITSDFPFTSELQTPIPFLFVTENSKCGCAFSQYNVNILVAKLFGFAKKFGSPFTVGEPLHVAFKKYKIKRKFTFFW